MEVTGKITVDAASENIIEQMQEPDVLQRTIPNCNTVEQIGEREYTAEISESISRISFDMETDIEITEFNPPERFTIDINGEAPGSNTQMDTNGAFYLSIMDNGRTQINYEMDINVSGKLASLGFRMLKSTITKRVDQMTDNIKNEFTDEPTG